MPINPLIPLSAKPASFDTNRLTQMAANPLSEQVKTNRAVNQQARQSAYTDQQLNDFKATHLVANRVKPFLESGDIQGAQSVLEQSIASLNNAGIKNDNLQQGLQLLQQDPSGKTLLQTVNNVLQAGERLNIVPNNTPTSVKDRNDLISRLPVDAKGNLKPESEWTAEQKAIAIEAGIFPRAMGSAAITTAQQGLTNQVASSESTIEGAKAGAKEAGKLDVQAQKLPDIRAAITKAETLAKSQGEALTDFNRAKAAMPGLVETLEACLIVATAESLNPWSMAFLATGSETIFPAGSIL